MVFIMLRNRNVVVLLLTAVYAAGCTQTDFPATPQFKGSAKRLKDVAMPNAPQARPPTILPETFFAAGKLFEAQGLRDKAIHQFRKAIAVNHEFVAAYHRLGLMLSAAGERDQALEALQRAVVLHPDSPVLHNNLGYELMLHERWTDAVVEFDRAVELKPDFARAFINRGLALGRLERFDAALASFQAVLPEADAQYNLGLMLQGQQRHREAADAFARVLEIDEQFSAARRRLEQLAPRLEQLAPRLETAVFAEPEPTALEEQPFPPLMLQPVSESHVVSSLDPSKQWSSVARQSIKRWISESFKGSWFDESDWTPAPDSDVERLEATVSAIPTPIDTRPLLEGWSFEGPPAQFELEQMLSIVRNEIACLELGAAKAADRAQFVSAERPEEALTADMLMLCEAEEALASSADDAWVNTESQEASESASIDFPLTESRPTMALTIIPDDGESSDESPLYDDRGWPITDDPGQDDVGTGPEGDESSSDVNDQMGVFWEPPPDHSSRAVDPLHRVELDPRAE